MTMKKYMLMACLTLLLALGSTGMVSCKNTPSDTNDEKVESQQEESSEDNSLIADADSEEPEVDAEDVEDLSNIQEYAGEDEVWTSLGGLYSFIGDEPESIVGLDVDVEDDTKCTLLIGEESYKGRIENGTGRITAYDSKGDVVFVGAVYAGGNLLKGQLRGKPVRYEGACGL